MHKIGDKFGKLTLISYFQNDPGKPRKGVFRCECGVEKNIRLGHVVTGKTVSCGCVKRKHFVHVGQRIGRLVVKSIDHANIKGHLKVPVICDCGTEKLVGIIELATSQTKSCGCVSIEKLSERSYKHGGDGTSLYAVWHGMKNRCLNQKLENYPIYGGRGISVCEEWSRDFSIFRTWALLSCYTKGLQIDRIDVNGNYEPSNCRWVTAKVNGNNRRDNVILHIFGESRTMKQWSEDSRCVVNYSTLRQRISRYQWPHEEALTTISRKGDGEQFHSRSIKDNSES